jgi:exodeoxyribonuclease VII small subunit
MVKKTPAETPPPENYGAAVQELERLIAELESGQLPLEELLGRYRRGCALLAYCRAQLQEVEDQVRILDESGDAQPWKPE